MNPQPTPNASHSHTAQAGQHHSDACVAATFGESFVSLRLAGAPARYTFSACRGMRRLDPKDSETGYSYFGARYYESGLSIWLSVDPLADKYPSLSSYVYCANNPVILVDPDGRDIWSVNDDGCLALERETNDDFDIIVTRSDWEERNIDEGLKVDKGIFQNQWGRTLLQKKPLEIYDVDFMNVTGDEKASELFNFLADNTAVEWSHTMIGAEEDQQNVISTSHRRKEAGAGYLFAKGYIIREHIHNHFKSKIPSPADTQWHVKVNDEFPNAETSIRYNGNNEKYSASRPD